jgi:hypothetical protein
MSSPNEQQAPPAAGALPNGIHPAHQPATAQRATLGSNDEGLLLAPLLPNELDQDPHRRQGFRLEDLVVFVFLPENVRRREDLPVYRVTGYDTTDHTYRLMLHRDPVGGSMFWINRNWGMIRIFREEV